MILFPDLGNSCIYRKELEESTPDMKIDNDNIQSEVASALPLAMAMGAKISMHLHENLSHILCNLVCDSLHWHPRISMNVFHDCNHGSILHEKLKEMHDEGNTVDITLVSPGWIRNKWKC